MNNLVAGLVGLDDRDLSDSDTKAIQSIVDFVVADRKDIPEHEVVASVRSLEQKLGSTTLGERRIDKLYRHVKLQSHVPS